MTTEQSDLPFRAREAEKEWLMNDPKIRELQSLSLDNRKAKLEQNRDDYIGFFEAIIGFSREDEEHKFNINWDRAFKKDFESWSEERKNIYLSKKFIDKLQNLPEFPNSFNLSKILKILLGTKSYQSYVHFQRQRYNIADEEKELDQYPSSSPNPEQEYSFYELIQFLQENVIKVLDEMADKTRCPEMKTLWLLKTLQKRKKHFEELLNEMEKHLPSDFFYFDQKNMIRETPFSGSSQKDRSHRSKSGDMACLRFNTQSFKQNSEITLSSQEAEISEILLSPCSRKFPFKPSLKKKQLDKSSQRHEQGFVEIVQRSFEVSQEQSESYQNILCQFYQCVGKGVEIMLPNRWSKRAMKACAGCWKKEK